MTSFANTMSGAQHARLWLTIRGGKEHGRVLAVAGERVLLGRDDTCGLVVDDAKVSRRHVSLEPLPDGRVLLRDLGSSNGTFVNGARVQSAVLHGDEQIQVGDTVLVSSQREPATSGATEIGLLAAATRTPSAVHRMLVQRSLRRVTILATAAVATAVGTVVLLATGTLSAGDDNDAARIVRQVAPSTVFVEALRDGRRVHTGTGWVLDGAERLVVTSAHVLNGATSLVAGTESDASRATIVGVAPCEDLAVVRVPGLAGLPALPLGDQSSLEQGQTVVAVGYAANASGEARLTSTTGVVSVARTVYRESTPDVPRYPNVVQTDAALNPGNSGGPLVDLDGRLVGVNTAVRIRSSDGRPIQGQGYAIGIDRVEEVVFLLRAGRSLGWTGLGFEYPPGGAAGSGGMPVGLAVSGAVPGTPADRAGLGDGDTVVAVNGMPVGTSLAGYCDAVSGLRSGDRVRLSVRRSGYHRPRALMLTLP